MFPAPTTIAISTPLVHTSTISSATASIVSRSIPYSRSPIRHSPESFSRMRRKTTCVPGTAARVSSDWTVISADERETLELEHFCALFVEHLSHRLPGVVDPLLFGQHAVREEPLVQHSFDDLARLLRLRLHLVGVRENLALGGHDVVGDVVASDPLRGRRGDVHRELPREAGRAPAELHEHAELVRRRMDIAFDQRAVDGFEGHRPDDRDVLADLGDELVSLLLELLDLLGEVRAVRGLEDSLRECAKL